VIRPGEVVSAHTVCIIAYHAETTVTVVNAQLNAELGTAGAYVSLLRVTRARFSADR